MSKSLFVAAFLLSASTSVSVHHPEITNIFTAAVLWLVIIYTLDWLPILAWNLNLFWNIHLALHTSMCSYSFIILYMPNVFFLQHKSLLYLRDHLVYLILVPQFNLTCTLYWFSPCKFIRPEKDGFPFLSLASSQHFLEFPCNCSSWVWVFIYLWKSAVSWFSPSNKLWLEN